MKRRYFRSLLLSLLGAVSVLCSISDVAAHSVVIMASDSLTSTRRAISGARTTITSQHADVVIHYIHLRPETESLIAQTDSIKSIDPDVILTVGSAATRLAQTSFPDKPIVFSAVMYPVISGFIDTYSEPGKLTTGASLDIPPDIQFRYFSQLYPGLKEVGVLYTDHTEPLIRSAQHIAEGMGINLTAVKVSDQKELPKALDSLSKRCQGLWSVADPELFSPQSTKYILLFALKHNLPLMGFSRNVVESGALFALDFDYKAIGRQAGRLVNKVISGTPPGELSVTVPDILWFHYNEKTAARIRIDIPADLVAIAKEVYR